MTDLSVLLAAVLRDPGDDLARMAYADACEESGDAHRAEFIRLDMLPDDCERAKNLWKENERSWFLGLETCRSPRYFMDGGSKFEKNREARDAALIGLVERGFVSRLRGPLQTLLKYLPDALLAHPITRLVVTDKSPNRSSMNAGWWNEDSPYNSYEKSRIPGLIWCRLAGGFRHDGSSWRTYSNDEEAEKDLHAAVFAYTRERNPEHCLARGGPP